MQRTNFVTKFSKRLNASLQKEGYISNRSKAGTEVRQLAEAVGVSYQMARKYVLGMALPDYHAIAKIAKWLNISPSWLLFGEKEPIMPQVRSASAIEIDIELLKYILIKCTILFPPIAEPEKIANYIAGIIYDAAHINADAKMITKIIDMMLSSAVQLSEINLEKRA